jgi:hypothetical protein
MGYSDRLLAIESAKGRMACKLAVATLPVLLAGAGVGAADSTDIDLRTLNDCIGTAVESGQRWPFSPIDVLGHLFSVAPDCVTTAGAPQLQASSADSTVAATLRHAVPRLPYPGQWLEVDLSREEDGSWRIRRILPYVEAREGQEIAQALRMRVLAFESSGFDTGLGPLALLDFLRERRGAWRSSFFPKDWIKESDLPALMDLLDASDPCAGVIGMASSASDTSTSTVGNEAAYLIEGYRKGYYPPRALSTRPLCDVQEIREWWKKREHGDS